MGYIKTANDIINNTTSELDDILNSSFTQFLQGLGQPVLVKWWNVNETLSTADVGTGTIDELLGPNSPLRYNVVNDLPTYGGLTKDLIVDINGGSDEPMDLESNIELVVLPNSVKPSPYDFIEYKFGKRKEHSVLYQVTGFTLSTVKSNNFYRVTATLYDIDYGNGESKNDKIQLLQNQVVKDYRVKLDNIGTNDKALIEDLKFSEIESLERLKVDLLEQYLDVFYTKRYNALVLHNELPNGWDVYDPWITNFVIVNNILEDQITLVNFDMMDDLKKKYNKTLYHALEIRNMKYFREMLYAPVTFSRVSTTPFAYYGETTTFKLDLYEEKELHYPRNLYMRFNFFNNIARKEESPSFNFMENLIIRYFCDGDLEKLFDKSDIDNLKEVVIEHTEYWLKLIPMIIFLMNVYIRELTNSYQ